MTPKHQTRVEEPRRSRLRTLRRHAQYHGVWSAAALLVLQPLQQLRVLRIGGVFRTPTASRSDLPTTTPALEVRFLDESEIAQLVAAGTGWFFPEAVARSLARGERCVAVIRDGSVVHSRWIAPGPLRQMGVDLEVPPDTMFVQRIFTSPEARGAGLAVHAQRFASAQLEQESSGRSGSSRP